VYYYKKPPDLQAPFVAVVGIDKNIFDSGPEWNWRPVIELLLIESAKLGVLHNRMSGLILGCGCKKKQALSQDDLVVYSPCD